MAITPSRTLIVDSLDDSETLDSFISFTGGVGGGPTRPDEVLDRDSTDGAGLTLREAIHLANLYEEFDRSATRIEFSATLDDQIYRLTQGEITIEANVIIDGDRNDDVDPDIIISGDANADDRDSGGRRLAGDGTGITDLLRTNDQFLLDNTRIFDVASDAFELELEGLTLTGGRAAVGIGGGGAVRTPGVLTLNNSILEGNSTSGTGASGGAVLAEGELEILGSTFHGNETDGSSGGAVRGFSTVTIANSEFTSNTSSGDQASGGAVSSRGDLNVTSSTFSNNAVLQGYQGRGGALASAATANLTNVTLVGNKTGGEQGWGAGVFAGGDLSLVHTTITGNTTSGPGAYGGGAFALGDYTLRNSIIAGNATLGSFGNAQDISGYNPSSSSFEGGNIVGTRFTLDGVRLSNSVAIADIFEQTQTINGVESGVAANNGGRVQTVALKNDAANPALDAGPPTLFVFVDARGSLRLLDLPGVAGQTGGITDLGAFELNFADDDVAPAFEEGAVVTYDEGQSAGAELGAVPVTDIFLIPNLVITNDDDGFFQINDRGFITLTADGRLGAANDFEVGPNTFTLTIEAADAFGNASTGTVTLSVANIDDETPIIGPNRTIEYVENQTAGSVIGRIDATDDVGIEDFEIISGDDAGFFELADLDDSGLNLVLTAAGAASAANDFETGLNEFSLEIRVDDASGKDAEALFTVSVTDFVDETPPVIEPTTIFYDENTPPNTVIGVVNIIDDSEIVSVGAAFDDFEADVFRINTDGEITLSNRGTGSPANDFEVFPNTFSYAIVAEDAGGNRSIETITLNLRDIDDVDPVVPADQIFSYDENSPAGTFVGKVEASDNGTISGFEIISGDPSGFFEIDDGGNITLSAEGAAASSVANDAERLPNTFSLAVEVTDVDGNVGEGTVRVSVNDVDDFDPVILKDQEFSYQENSAAGLVVGTIEAQDNVGVVGFAITRGDDGEFFAIDDQGVLTLTDAGETSEANDFEDGDNTFALTIQATDAAGNTGTRVVLAVVQDVDDTAPVIEEGQEFTVIENSSAGAFLGRVEASGNVGITEFEIIGGNDDGFFAIDDLGVLTLTLTGSNSAANDFETGDNSFVLIVQARDGNGLVSSESVTVNVRDVDDTGPVIEADQELSYNENQSVNAVLGTVQASDPSGIASFIITAGNDDNFFAIDDQGVVTLTTAGVNSAANDFETGINSVPLIIEARDTVGNVSSESVVLRVRDVDDTPPVIRADQEFIYVENQLADAALGTVQAEDKNGIERFSIIAGNDDKFFVINSQGIIRLTTAGANSAANEFESGDNSFVLAIEASDPSGNTSDETVTVSVQDLDDSAPVFEPNQSFSYDEGQTAGAILGQVIAVDNVAVTGFNIVSGDDDMFFTIDDTGILSLTDDGALGAANDFSLTPNMFSLLVRATDAEGNVSSDTIEVDVTEVVANTPPNATITQEEIDEDQLTLGGTPTQSFRLQRFVVDADRDNVEVPSASIRYDAAASDLSSLEPGFDLNFQLVGRQNNIIRVRTDQFDALGEGETASLVFSYDATDGKDTATLPFTVIVNGVNDAPDVPEGQSFEVDEGAVTGTPIGTVAASDVDGGPLKFGLGDSGSEPLLLIDESTGELTAAPALASAAPGDYVLSASVGDGFSTIIENFTITVNETDPADDATVSVVNSWGSGAILQIAYTLTPGDGEDVTQWTFDIDTPEGVFVNGWLNGYNDSVSFDASTGMFEDRNSYNGEPSFGPGDTIVFNVQLDGLSGPLDFGAFGFDFEPLTGTGGVGGPGLGVHDFGDLVLSVETSSQWSSGGVVRLFATNDGTSPIENVADLQFDFLSSDEADIREDQVWGFDLNGGILGVVPWNGSNERAALAPGQTVLLGGFVYDEVDPNDTVDLATNDFVLL